MTPTIPFKQAKVPKIIPSQPQIFPPISRSMQKQQVATRRILNQIELHSSHAKMQLNSNFLVNCFSYLRIFSDLRRCFTFDEMLMDNLVVD
jgi:hypothetical protein